jgi:hypothetical protein
VDEFLQATEREDLLHRAKGYAGTGLRITTSIGKVFGIDGLSNLAWPMILVAALAGFFLGLLLLVQVTASIVAALPIGFVLTRLGQHGGSAARWAGETLTAPNEGRRLVDSVVVPAERRFFLQVQGRPPSFRTTTMIPAAGKSVAALLGAAVLAGLVLGVLIALASGLSTS